MLTLESFKLLNSRIAQFERSTGGTPEITYQEVADVLSKCSKQYSMYGRYNYALDNTYQRRLVEAITDRMMLEDRKRKRPLLPHRQDWRGIMKRRIEMCSVCLINGTMNCVANSVRGTSMKVTREYV